MSDREQTAVQAASLGRRAFKCPHCHAHAQQGWWALYAQHLSQDDKLPTLDPERIRAVMAEHPEDDTLQQYGIALLAKDARPVREKESIYVCLLYTSPSPRD